LVLQIFYIGSIATTILYWFGFFIASLKKSTLSSKTLDKPGVSIILAYKNESANIRRCILALLEQQYPVFEVVAVDDFSSDGSSHCIADIKDQRLVLLKSTEDHPGKKKALNQAISAAKYDNLLFTDADCIPNSQEWIQTMMAAKNSYDVVLGYGPLITKNSILGRWQYFETLMTAIQYFSYCLLGYPYMGVGRNMLVSKKAFAQIKGYQRHMHIMAGDDDLLIQDLAKAGYTVNVCWDTKAWVYSHAKPEWKSYVAQKTRHIGTSYHYHMDYKLVLGLYALLPYIFWTSFLCLIFDSVNIQWLFVTLIFKWFLQFALIWNWLRRLDSLKLMWILPLADLFTPIYQLILLYKTKRGSSW
jgi:hypothetical protein